MKCNQCKYYKAGECIYKKQQGRRVLVETDFYCDRWVGASGIVVNLKECDEKINLSSRFGGFATLYTKVRDWGKEEDRYEIELGLLFDNALFNSSSYLTVKEANESLKQAGFEVVLVG